MLHCQKDYHVTVTCTWRFALLCRRTSALLGLGREETRVCPTKIAGDQGLFTEIRACILLSGEKTSSSAQERWLRGISRHGRKREREAVSPQRSSNGRKSSSVPIWRTMRPSARRECPRYSSPRRKVSCRFLPLSQTVPPGFVHLSLSLDFLYLFSPPPFPFPFIDFDAFFPPADFLIQPYLN